MRLGFIHLRNAEMPARAICRQLKVDADRIWMAIVDDVGSDDAVMVFHNKVLCASDTWESRPAITP